MIELLFGIALLAMAVFQIQQSRKDAAARILWHDRFLATMRAERQRERKFLLELAQLTAAAKTSRSGFELSATAAALKEDPLPEAVLPDARPRPTFKLDGTDEEITLVHGFEDLIDGPEEKKS